MLGAMFVATGAGLLHGLLQRSESVDVATLGSALFALTLAVMGGVLLTSRRGLVIDPAAGQITTWWRVFGRKREQSDSLGRYARVCVTEENAPLGDTARSRFTVRLEGEAPQAGPADRHGAGRSLAHEIGLGERFLRWSSLVTLDVFRCAHRGEAIEEGTRLAQLTSLPLVEDLDPRAP